MLLESYCCGQGQVSGKVMFAWNKVGGRMREFSWLRHRKRVEVEKGGKLGMLEVYGKGGV